MRHVLSIVMLLLALTLAGTVGFKVVDPPADWLDCLYMAVITLTTVGYGDFSPVTFAGRLFTMFYVLIGIGIIVALISRIASNAAEARVERRKERRRRRES